MRKLIVAVEKMKKYPSLSQNMQILETFRNYIRPVDKEFTRTLGRILGRPAFFAMPRLVVELLFGEMGREALLSSCRVKQRAPK